MPLPWLLGLGGIIAGKAAQLNAEDKNDRAKAIADNAKASYDSEKAIYDYAYSSTNKSILRLGNRKKVCFGYIYKAICKCL